MGTHPIFESDFDCLTDSAMSDNEFEVVDDFEVGEEKPVIVAQMDYSKANGVICELEKETSKTAHFDTLDAGIDKFADDMIRMINKHRQQLKATTSERRKKTATTVENARQIIGEIKQHIQRNTDAQPTLDHHSQFIRQIQGKLDALIDIKKRETLILPERELNELFGKYFVVEQSKQKQINEKRPVKEEKPSYEQPFTKRQKRDVNQEGPFAKFIDHNAEPIITGAQLIDSLGAPFGKELTGFNLVELAAEKGSIGAEFVRKFGDYEKPMGCDIMIDEVIVCNMNRNQVQFHDLDGAETLCISETKPGTRLFHPSNATVLLDARIVIRDDSGVHIYDEDAAYLRSLTLPTGAKVYGIMPVRARGGELAIFVQLPKSGYRLIFFDKELEKVTTEIEVNLPSQRRPMIRFCGNLGNTFYLSDMSFDNNCIWLVDLKGRIRSVAGLGGKGTRPGQFVQAAGLAVDNGGNFLAICSKTSRIMAFASSGDFIGEVKFEQGPVERPSDIAINDEGVVAITSLKGQIHLLKLIPIDPATKWETCSKFEHHQHHHQPTRGRSRGRGGRGRGGRS